MEGAGLGRAPPRPEARAALEGPARLARLPLGPRRARPLGGHLRSEEACVANKDLVELEL